MINVLVYQTRTFLTLHVILVFLFSQSFLISARDGVAQEGWSERKQISADVEPGPNYSSIIYPGEDGRLIYVPDENGNTILDFSNCGYMGGGVKLPYVGVKKLLEPAEGDDTARIQTAIDEVARLTLDESGFRGAVLLKKGQYEIGGSIRIQWNKVGGYEHEFLQTRVL